MSCRERRPRRVASGARMPPRRRRASGGNNRGARRRARRGIVVSRGGRRAGVTPRGGEGSRRGEGRRGGRRGRPGTGSSRAWGARGPGPRARDPEAGVIRVIRCASRKSAASGWAPGSRGARRARAWRAGSVRANVSCPGGWETREPPRGSGPSGGARGFWADPPARLVVILASAALPGAVLVALLPPVSRKSANEIPSRRPRTRPTREARQCLAVFLEEALS